MADKKITELTVLNTPSATSKFLVAENGQSYQISLGNIATNLPNVKSSGVLGVGVSDEFATATAVNRNKTVVRLSLALGESYILTPGFLGEIVYFVSESSIPQQVSFIGYNVSTATLNNDGSTLGLIYTGEKWAVISAYNTSLI